MLLICTTSYPQQPYSQNIKQNNTDSTLIHNDFYKLPRFDIHIGAALVNGGRIGIRTLILKNFSVEFFYGYNLANFVSASDAENRYGFGMNWHKDNSNFVLSLLGTKSHFLNSPKKDNYYMSLNIGWISFNGKSFHTFLRAGPALRFSNNTGDNSLSVKFTPNIDVGISFVIY